MIETMAGIWLLILTMGAGFLWGRFGGIKERSKTARKKSAGTQVEMGWQELLNFLQYDGSGLPPVTEKTERREG
jgi:hypothetical protein